MTLLAQDAEKLYKEKGRGANGLTVYAAPLRQEKNKMKNGLLLVAAAGAHGAQQGGPFGEIPEADNAVVLRRGSVCEPAAALVPLSLLLFFVYFFQKDYARDYQYYECDFHFYFLRIKVSGLIFKPILPQQVSDNLDFKTENTTNVRF